MLEYLVLDAGAIIKGHGMNLFKDSNVIVTVPEVIAEIRDSKSRDLLSRLPFELEERAPSAESLRTGRVASFRLQRLDCLFRLHSPHVYP